MLAPDDRQLLVESLAPPLGAAFDEALATTFTLDLEALLIPALAFTAGAASGAIGDPLATLEALRRTGDRIDIFAQSGAITVPKRGEDLFAFLEPMVHQVHKPGEGLFHPKLWAVRYRDEATKAPSYRVLVLSRNLTLDNSWDVIVRLDSESVAPRIQEDNQPLSAFLASLPQRAGMPVGSDRRDRVESFAKEIRRVVWKAPEGLQGPTFHYLSGRGGHGIDLEGRRHLVVSPFVNDEGIAMFADSPDLTVVSRIEELEKLSSDVAQSLSSYVLDVPPSDAPEQEMPERSVLGLLHAKAYVIEPGGRAQRARLIVGSANATNIAFTNNVEFLVEFEGRRRDLGVDALLGPEAGFRQMVREYEATGGETLSPTDQLQRTLENALRAMAEITHTVEVHRGGESSHSLTLRANQAYHVPEGADVSVELLTRRGVAHRPAAGVPLEISVHDVETTQITPFLAIRLQSEDVVVETIVIARIENDPADRLDEVLASQFDDPEKFRRFLLMVLSPGEFEFAASVTSASGTRSAGAAPGARDAAILDLVLARLADGSASLGDLGSLVDRLRATEHGMKAFPDGFLDLWAEVEQAAATLSEDPR